MDHRIKSGDDSRVCGAGSAQPGWLRASKEPAVEPHSSISSGSQRVTWGKATTTARPMSCRITKGMMPL